MLPVPKLNATALVKLRMCVKGLNTVFATCAKPLGIAIKYLYKALFIKPSRGSCSANCMASANSCDVNLPFSGLV